MGKRARWRKGAIFGGARLPNGLMLFAKNQADSWEFNEIRPNCAPSRGPGYATFKEEELHSIGALAGHYI